MMPGIQSSQHRFLPVLCGVRVSSEKMDPKLGIGVKKIISSEERKLVSRPRFWGIGLSCFHTSQMFTSNPNPSSSRFKIQSMRENFVMNAEHDKRDIMGSGLQQSHAEKKIAVTLDLLTYKSNTYFFLSMSLLETTSHYISFVMLCVHHKILSLKARIITRCF